MPVRVGDTMPVRVGDTMPVRVGDTMPVRVGVRLADDHVHVHRLAAPAVHALEHALVRKRSVVQRLVQRDDARPSAQDACGELGKLSEHAALEDGGGQVHHIGAGEVMNEEVAAMHRRWWQRGREAACGCRESSESLLCCSV